MALFFISFVVLFLELACIRWFGATVVFLTFFTNIVLLATFLGMSVGCLAASSRRQLTEIVIPLLLGTIVLAVAVLVVFNRFSSVNIDVGGQGSPQQIYFGTEYRATDVSRFVVPIEAVAGIFFFLIAVVFVGLGQVMGRELARPARRLVAYTVNIAGSLLGIAAFALLSFLRTPAALWFAIALSLWLPFVARHRARQALAAAACVLVIVVADHAQQGRIFWSPYYKIDYTSSSRFIATNNIGHQQMMAVGAGGAGYVLPHLLNRDAGGLPFKDVLIIGAGSGNDVAAALRSGAGHVDAVEIDPQIYDLGRRDHPDRPYADPRVTIHIDDGRSFLRGSGRKYDLIVYALVDSLVLHSGYSTIRLESFLFTRDAFEDVRAHLKPGGLFAAYNSYRQGWLVGRLTGMMTAVFGAPPLVISLPYVARIAPGDPQTDRVTFILDGADAPALEQIRARLARDGFWMNDAPSVSERRNGFGPRPAAAGIDDRSWRRVGPSVVEIRSNELTPTDDWPFLYLRDAVVPAVNVRGLVVMALASLAVLAAFAPAGERRPNWRMFFIGAGFMLLETKSIVHLALLFGSTWMVNSIVVFAILVMILCSNVWVLATAPRRLWPYYGLLAASLLVGIAVPMDTFLALPATARVVASCAVVFAPIFFAGIVFAAVFRDSTRPDADFGWNIAGAIVGGLAESLSLVVGFNQLLVVALAFYGLSAAARPRAARAAPSFAVE